MTGRASPRHFCHKKWGVYGLVRGDVIVFVGAARRLNLIAEHMSREVRVAITGQVHKNELRILNRSIW